jgi:hypothetical protein
MNKVLEDLKKMCNPAFVYLVISVASILIIALQNVGNTDKYCIGLYECYVPNTFVVFLFKILYVLFWTFILNVLCKGGYKNVAWFLVLLPFILLFVIIGWFLINQGVKMIQ